MIKPLSPERHVFRAATRRTFAVVLTVISAIAAFAIAGDATQCALCRGTALPGTSAPALVTQQMPLTAPGSLSAEDNAAIMAYRLSYDCVTPLQDGKMPFPTSDSKLLTKVIVGGTTCPR
jgi:hypothetical protein